MRLFMRAPDMSAGPREISSPWRRTPPCCAGRAGSTPGAADSVEIGLPPVFAEAENPFPRMSEAMDLKKEKNVFETRVIEYQNRGALEWD
jgi:hypothetical protein